jgi:endo-1,3-1,4-beta-glycanase ExoK
MPVVPRDPLNHSRRPNHVLLLAFVLLVLLLLAYWLYLRTRDPAAQIDRGDGLSFMHQFDTAAPKKTWSISDFSFESPFYRTGFRAENVVTAGGFTQLRLDRRDTRHQPNSGAELEKRGFYHYGRYEVVMRPAQGSGVVSSFFTHTFHLFGDPHDEIDIEFLGKDTRKVSLNAFADGKPFGPVSISLPFDAADAPHLYAFDWSPEKIDWWIDGQRVHRLLASEHALPSAPGRVMMNIWTGSEAQYDWHGEPSFKDGTSAAYYCVSFQALGDDAPQCSDTFFATPIGD